MTKNKGISKLTSQFKGVLTSGFLIHDPRFITTVSLLFDKVYIPNNLEFVIEFSKKHRLLPSVDVNKFQMSLEPVDDNDDDPFQHLTKKEKETANYYLFHSQNFCLHNHELFPTVLQTSLFKKGEPMAVKLLKKGVNGKKNLYRVTTNPLIVTLDGFKNLKKELDNNAVPIIEWTGSKSLSTPNNLKQNKEIASILAMKSIEMLLPSFKAVKPQLILEARDKLSDQLPQYWSTMLKFSNEAKQIISGTSSLNEAFAECQNLVDSTIRPAVIDLNKKMELERKNWFYRILNPVGKTIKLLVGQPAITTQDLLSASISLTTNVSSDFIKHKRKIEELQNDAGLTYLFELNKIIDNG